MTRRSSDERGSALALVPAGFLVLLLLGAISVDSAVAYLGQRQLTDATSGAANDAATAALDDGAFYAGGTLQIDSTRAAAVVCRSLASQGNGELHGLTVAIAVGGPVIRVRASAEVDEVFGRLIPGFGHQAVSGEATAVAARGVSLPGGLPHAFEPISCRSVASSPVSK